MVIVSMNGKSAICYQRMFGQNPWWPRYLGLFAKAGTVKIVTNTSPKLVDKCVQCMMEGYAEKMMSMYIICWAHLLDGCIQQGMWSGWGIYVSEKYRKILWSDSRRNRVSNTITAGRRGVWGDGISSRWTGWGGKGPKWISKWLRDLKLRKKSISFLWPKRKFSMGTGNHLACESF